MESMLRNKKTILLFLLPAALIYLAIVAIPVFSTVYNSFFKWNLVDARKFVAIRNFIQLFTIDDIFRTGLKNTLLLTFLSLLIQTPISILLALALSGSLKGGRYFKTVYFMPNILSSVAIGLLWSFVFNPDFGIINQFLSAIGLKGLQGLWLADERTVLLSIIIVICWQFVGYHMIIYLAAIQNIPVTLYESATIDGASWPNRVRYIILPLIKPIIGIDAVLIVTGSLRFFDLIYVMSNGGPKNDPNYNIQVMPTFTDASGNKVLRPNYAPVFRTDRILSVSSKSKNAVSVVKFLDFIFSDKGQLVTHYGVEGKNYEVKDGQNQFTYDWGTEAAKAIGTENLAMWQDRLSFPMPIDNEAYYKSLDKFTQGFSPDYMNNNVQVYPLLKYTAEQLQERSNLDAKVETEFGAGILNFVTGKTPMSDWDKFVAHMTEVGYDKVTAIDQAAYDAMNK
jgi:raffinose/stachyose/melibiose transport system permease protein